MTQGKTTAAGPLVRLLGLASGVAFIWLILLPAAADWPAVTERRQSLQDLGIDPAARLYSDHPGSPRNLAEIDNAKRRSNQRLWLPMGSRGNP